MLSKFYRGSWWLNHKARKFLVLWSFCVVSLSISLPLNTAQAGVFDPAYANPLYNCNSGTGCCVNITSLVRDMFRGQGLFTGQQDLQIYYYTNTLWPKIETALKQLTNELRNAQYFALAPRGAMLDAQNLNKSLTAIQKQTSQTLVTQTASDQICRFGTLSRSLAASADRSEVVQKTLADGMMHRQLMRKNIASEFEGAVESKQGRGSDKIARFNQFKNTFCDPSDSDGTMKGVCGTTTDVRMNKDIDIARSLFYPQTLDIDFVTSSTTATADEENIMALANNLYAHDLPVNLSKSDFKIVSIDGGAESDKKIEGVIDYRALTAKRSVAQNSFATIAAMKAEGSGASTQYMKEMIAQLGLDSAGQNTFLGGKPSYYAQMELLTRKIYQSPDFYANLMDSKTNVARQQVAMEGIGLMQDRDIFESLRRSEMVLSTLLEIYVDEQQSADKDRGTK